MTTALRFRNVENGAPFQTGTAWPPRSGLIRGAPWLSRSSRPFACLTPTALLSCWKQ